MKKTILFLAEIDTEDYPDWETEILKYLPSIASEHIKKLNRNDMKSNINWFLVDPELNFESANKFFSDARSMENILTHWPSPDDDEEKDS